MRFQEPALHSTRGEAAVRALLLALAILLAACSPESAHFNATDVTGGDWGRDFRLADASGKTRQLADFKGKAVVIFFGYVQCPDVCPTTMNKLREVMEALGGEADRVQVLFVTLDPERDTPELLAQYVSAFDARFLGLYGDPDKTAAMAKDFRVFYQKQAGSKPGRYTIDHTAGLYIYDPQGRLRLFVASDEEAAKIAADLRQLLAGR
ncbi:putative Cytochrome oxidase biogenesis protein Sco1/SenC/PrrC, copper metallochaperone [Georgfuchsia toluolica]|uniref:Cytochrome oxidase biogenesis protein Sco1/SenC/PrrC, copper metallochaperone n=1 Tax=Georgfuchsia toluolica TaxID=424218 RepID=A0A916J5S9_9PROT|nr:SCO family protein [Georgfuchsia toluolica]CAG4884508.1 putative Cytochrome oxidase biogenesis protein Sco1/SenC/PrrC, copper metallochaperone [Georgfuchsia toluolica]